MEVPLDIACTENRWASFEIKHYKIGTLPEHPLFESQIHVMENTSQIDSCFKKDFAWSLAGSLSENIIEIENLPLIGSWTSCNKMVTEFKTKKCIQ